MFWDIGLLLLFVTAWTLFKNVVGVRRSVRRSNNSYHKDEYDHHHPFHHSNYHSNDTDYSVPDSWDD